LGQLDKRIKILKMKPINELPIRLVVATKLKQENFLNRSATGRSVKSFLDTSLAQIRLYSENLIGLSELYNKAINEALNDEIILIFIHDDVLIADYFWADRVRIGLEKFDIVGLAGNSRRIPHQPSWCVIDTQGTLDDSKYLSGSIGQGFSFPPERFYKFGQTGIQCKLMDGVFLATTSAKLRSSNLRFDSQFKFHFYDIDFCRTAEMLGMSMGTIPLSVVHQSTGRFDEAWQIGYKNYIAKWVN